MAVTEVYQCGKVAARCRCLKGHGAPNVIPCPPSHDHGSHPAQLMPPWLIGPDDRATAYREGYRAGLREAAEGVERIQEHADITLRLSAASVAARLHALADRGPQ